MHKRKNNKAPERKRYLGKTVFDKCSNRSEILTEIIKFSGIDLDTYELPMKTPNTKLHQHIFTLKKMKKKLNF